VPLLALGIGEALRTVENVSPLIDGTGVERIGDESLTRYDSGFVHRNL